MKKEDEKEEEVEEEEEEDENKKKEEKRKEQLPVLTIFAISLRSFNTREEKQKYNSITYPKCQQQPLKNNFAICSTGKTRIRKRVAQALSCCCYWKKIDGREIRVRE